MLLAYAIAVTLALSIVWLAADAELKKRTEERDAAFALQERERCRLQLALDELDRIDPTGLAMARVKQGDREALQ